MINNVFAPKRDLSRFLQSQTNIFLAKVLPFSIYRRYLSVAGFYYFGTNGDARKSLSKSLKYVFGETIGRTRFIYILLKTYLGIFEHYYEKMVNAHRSLPLMMRFMDAHISISGKDWLDKIQKEGKGGILVTGHFGAVEYIPLFLASKHYRPSIILRFKSEKLKEALADKSSSVDLELIDADSPNVIFKALHALKKGRLLITLCDEIHHWRPCSKDAIPLFGRLIPKDRTLDILYRRSKAPISFGMIQRLKNRYDLSIHPIADGQEDISLCEASWQLLEQYVYQYPEQWYQWPKFHSEFTQYMMNRPQLCELLTPVYTT
jgi:KDO2-lipid IV(A) lauroyltransferase